MLKIPDKTYFKIGEAAKLIDVKPYIIRYWESEFKQLKPSKTRSGQRLFTRDDIELLYLIRTLLYQRRYTVEGAGRRIEEIRDAGVSYQDFIESLERGEASVPGEQSELDSLDEGELIAELRAELEEAKALLEKRDARLESIEAELKEERLIAAKALKRGRELEATRSELKAALKEIVAWCSATDSSSHV